MIESQAVASYQIISRDISVAEGKMRIKSILSNGLISVLRSVGLKLSIEAENRM